MIWFKFYTAWGEGIMELSDAEAGRFIKAVCSLADGGENPALSGNERILFAMVRKQIEQDRERAEKTSSVRAEVGRLGGISSAKQRQAIVSNCNQSEANASDDKQMQPNAFNKELRIKNQEVRSKNEELSATAAPIAPAPAKPTKHRHGQFQHVLLTDEEYQKLLERFSDAEKRIQNLDDYLENNRKKHYDNHYLTILTWARNDEQKQQQKPAVQPKRTYTFAEIGEMERNGELVL